MKKPVPKRLCKDPSTKYCKGHKNSRHPYGHRGCCDCHEYNNENWDSDCNPWMLPERLAELKQWCLDNDMNWED